MWSHWPCPLLFHSAVADAATFSESLNDYIQLDFIQFAKLLSIAIAFICVLKLVSFHR